MGEQWKQWQILFSWAPKPLQTVPAAVKLKMLFLWKKSYFANKGLSSQSYGFSSSHVWMWELDHKEGWEPKKDWRQEEKGMTEDEMVGWHHSLNGHEFEQTPGVGKGQGNLTCCSPCGCKESDTTCKESDTTEWLKNDKLLIRWNYLNQYHLVTVF